MRTHFFWVLATLIITACNNKQKENNKKKNNKKQKKKRDRQHGIGRFKDMERIAHCSSRSENKRNNPHGMRLDSR